MSSTLSKVSKNVWKDEYTSKGFDKFEEQLKNGEFHAGRGAEKLPGTKNCILLMKFVKIKSIIYQISSLLMAFIPNNPGHRKFAFRNLNSAQYKIYAQQYSKAKADGIRCVYGWISGAGIVGIVSGAGKGGIIDYGKRKFAAVCINAGAYILSPAVVIFTNASKIVNISKSIHSTAAFCFESIEDSTNLAFLPIDLALFGQPIPIVASNPFNLFSNHSDFLDG